MQNKFTKLLAAAVAALTPAQALACACGCALFDVGTSSLLPTSAGGLVFAEYNNISQNQNQRGTSAAPQADNQLKKIDTQIVTLGGQYMFNREWGMMAKLPYVMRDVNSRGTHTHHGEEFENHNMSALRRNSIGDVRLNGIYSGFSADMSTGLTFGVKLPTGATKHAGFGSDTQIGTGSTDIILGAYHLGRFNQSGTLGWFSQVSWQKPVLTKQDFQPGDETSFSLGSYYSLGSAGVFSKISPMLQIIGAQKSRDSGLNADRSNSGYRRVFIAPGVEFNFTKFKIYSDIELPIYDNVRGNQLAVAKIFKVILGYKF